MREFLYERPDTIAAAASAGVDGGAGGEVRYLAGGQTLIGAMKLGLSSPERLVDLSRIAQLRGISVDGAELRIGAMATHAQVAESMLVRERIPALARLAGGIGDPAVRNRGTIGGSLANSDPAACYPAGVLALGATIETDRRRIAADDFFLGLYETALQPGEIVVAARFAAVERAGWVKMPQPASRFSVVGVFVARAGSSARVAVTGAGPCVFRVPALEQALAREWSPKACGGVANPVDRAALLSDMHASADYRAHLIPVLAARAVAQSLEAAA